MTRCAHCHQPIAKRDGYWTHVATGRMIDHRPEQHVAAPDTK